jgi:hypothetical protein
VSRHPGNRARGVPQRAARLSRRVRRHGAVSAVCDENRPIVCRAAERTRPLPGELPHTDRRRRRSNPPCSMSSDDKARQPISPAGAHRQCVGASVAVASPAP